MHFPTIILSACSLWQVASAAILPFNIEVPADTAQLIQKKKLQYARFADTHQWEKFNQVAFPSCTYEYTDHGEVIVDHGFTYSWPSTQEFTNFFSAAFETLQTAHHIGPGEFEWVDFNTIKAIFPVVYYSALAKDANETHGVTGVGGGHYYETYKRKGLDWLMSECRMDRIYEQSS